MGVFLSNVQLNETTVTMFAYKGQQEMDVNDVTGLVKQPLKGKWNALSPSTWNGPLAAWLLLLKIVFSFYKIISVL